MSDKPPIDLPDGFRDAKLPEEAEQLYRDTFESAWANYGRNVKDETRARAIAWAEVRKKYPREEIDGWSQDDAEKKKPTIDPRLQ